MIRRVFRLRCRYVMGRGSLIYSLGNPDRLNEDGVIVPGTEFAVYGSETCSRWRWHRGDHRSST